MCVVLFLLFRIHCFYILLLTYTVRTNLKAYNADTICWNILTDVLMLLSAEAWCIALFYWFWRAPWCL
jgi:hypothetical protein